MSHSHGLVAFGYNSMTVAAICKIGSMSGTMAVLDKLCNLDIWGDSCVLDRNTYLFPSTHISR